MNEIVKHELSYELTDTEIDTLVQAGFIPRNTPPAQLSLFKSICRDRQLKPSARQIYLMEFNAKNPDGSWTKRYTNITSIDGYRLIAERTGNYLSSSDYVYDGNMTQYDAIKSGISTPTTATVTIKKIVKDKVGEFTATAAWQSYAPTGTKAAMWMKMPFLMLGKVAEALALRKAFPEQLSSIYVAEEMEQAKMDIEVKEVKEVKYEEVQLPAKKVKKERPYSAEDIKAAILKKVKDYNPITNKEEVTGDVFFSMLIKLSNDDSIKLQQFLAYLFLQSDMIELSDAQMWAVVKWSEYDASKQTFKSYVLQEFDNMIKAAEQQ